MTTKKHTLRVSILNEEYAIRSDRPPEHAKAVAKYLDQAIRKVMNSGGVVEKNKAVVLADRGVVRREGGATEHRGVDSKSQRLRATIAPPLQASSNWVVTERRVICCLLRNAHVA